MIADARAACGLRGPAAEISAAEADALIAARKRRRGPAAPAPVLAAAPAPADPGEAFVRGLMRAAGAPAEAIARAAFLATRPGWRAPAAQRRVSALTRAACEYAQDHNFAVFPMSRDKRPLVKGGFLAATRDCEQLEAGFERWPDALIAAATGALSGIVVLDLDAKGGKNGLASLRAAGASLPTLPADFWNARPELQAIRAFAHWRGVSAGAAVTQALVRAGVISAPDARLSGWVFLDGVHGVDSTGVRAFGDVHRTRDEEQHRAPQK